MIRCSSCKSGRLIMDPASGETVCDSCGRVVADRIEETRAEWRSHNPEINKSLRAGGAPSSLAHHDMGLSTLIGKDNKDSRGAELDRAVASSMNRLRTWDHRTKVHTPTERNLTRAFVELRYLQDSLVLSDAIVEKAAYIYRKAAKRKLIRGRSIISMLVASIYLACRELGTNKTLKEIAATADVRKKEISRNCRILIRELDIKTPLANPMKCIAKVANNAHVSERTKRRAIDMMGEFLKTEMQAGKSPMAFAATILYVSCVDNSEDISQKAVAEAAGITDVTLRNRLRDIRNSIEDL
jgi:transcription initiation factor TFIIB